RAYCLKTQPATGETYPKSDLFNKAAYCLKTQPATGETYPKSDLFNKAYQWDKAQRMRPPGYKK
ncbi:hypothetical protein, partial [Klebsiella pneumoniae]